MMPLFHSCFGHSYAEICIPLLSILHEYDESCLEKRGFQLFILKELPSDIQWQHLSKDFFLKWEADTIDFVNGTLKGTYEIFHKACSDSPILFERVPPPQRYIHFSTLIYGGNLDNQRCIHNSSVRYPGRPTILPVATDTEILRWIQSGKVAMARYLNISLLPSGQIPILFLAREKARTFDEASLNILSDILNTEPTYFERIPLNTQIEYIRDAKTIVAAHGSGLYHLIWCQPGTHVIEIFATDDPRKPIFESFCEVLGLRYTRIECSTEKGESDDCIHISPTAFSHIYSAIHMH